MSRIEEAKSNPVSSQVVIVNTKLKSSEIPGAIPKSDSVTLAVKVTVYYPTLLKLLD